MYAPVDASALAVPALVACWIGASSYYGRSAAKLRLGVGRDEFPDAFPSGRALPYMRQVTDTSQRFGILGTKIGYAKEVENGAYSAPQPGALGSSPGGFLLGLASTS